MSLAPTEMINLTRGDKLVCEPSGLMVEAWEVHSQGVEVRAPRGTQFTINYEHLSVPAHD